MDNRERFREMFVKGQGYELSEDSYPSYLEDEINKAVSYKRNKEYDKAVEIYLNIFEYTRCIYPDILEYLYKSLISGGHLPFAYEVILHAEIVAKKCWGMTSWLGEWSQTIKRKEFENIIIEFSKQPRSFLIKEGESISDEEIMKISENTKKVNQMIKEIASRYSGQSNYELPGSLSLSVDRMMRECMEMYQFFHEKYGHILK